jgi:hypothetical protein
VIIVVQEEPVDDMYQGLVAHAGVLSLIPVHVHEPVPVPVTETMLVPVCSN